MNAKPHVMLFALAVVCMAAVAWAADAPATAPAPPSHEAHAALTAHSGTAPVAADIEEEDGDELGLGGIEIEDGPDGGGQGGERRVIVRKMVRGGGGEGGPGMGCGMGACTGCSMGAGMGAGMGRGKGPGMGAGKGAGMFAHAMQALDLTDAQREKLADIHERQQRRDIQARADQQIARLDLRKAMTAEKPEASAINAQIDRVARLRTEMAKAHVAALLEARAVLTPEQQKQMREMRMRGPGAGMPGMGRGMDMGPGGMGRGGMGRGMRGDTQVHVRVERDTVLRN